MMRFPPERVTLAAATLILAAASIFAGCGGGSPAISPPPPPVGPTLTSLSPSSVVAGANGLTLTVNGQNLSSSAVVHWNGQAVPTTFVNNSRVTAAISPSLITAAGRAGVSAQNPGTFESNVLVFTINSPPAQISSISPDNAMAGAAPVVVAVNGSNFSEGATVLVDGSARQTYPKSATQLLVTLSVDDLAAARSISIAVDDIDLSAVPSNVVAFTVTPLITNPVPILTSSSDASVPAGWPGFQLTVQGTNFVAASALQWNGLPCETTVISNTELKAAIPASLLASPQALQIAVANPSPGGGTSSALPIQVDAVPPNAVGVIERSDMGNDLFEPNGNSSTATVSGDGRFVAFLSSASNLAPSTPDTDFNLFLRDTCEGAPIGCVPSVTLVPSHFDFFLAHKIAISTNGRFVGYSAGISFWLSDTCVGAPAGCVPSAHSVYIPENADVGDVSLSADGRFAVFLAGLFSCGDFDYGCNPPTGQVFLANTCAGVSSGCTPATQAITPIDVPADEPDSNAGFVHPSISPDGRYITFNSSHSDIWLYDSCQGTPSSCSPSKMMVSMATDGSSADGDSFGAAVSAGGRYVAFLSIADNLVPEHPQAGTLRVYFRDMCTGAPAGCMSATTLVAVAGDGTVSDDPTVSADGRYVAFTSAAADLVQGDTNGVQDVFVRDTCSGVASACTPATTRVSVVLDGAQGNAESGSPVISADGRFVVFLSSAKLGPGTNNLGAAVYLARH